MRRAALGRGAQTISVGNVYRGTFTPDGDTLYYFKKVTEGEEDYRIFRAHRTGRSWSSPDGPGGRELYFVRDFATIHRLPLDRALGPR
jgi:hypothetical protein